MSGVVWFGPAGTPPPVTAADLVQRFVELSGVESVELTGWQRHVLDAAIKPGPYPLIVGMYGRAAVRRAIEHDMAAAQTAVVLGSPEPYFTAHREASRRSYTSGAPMPSAHDIAIRVIADATGFRRDLRELWRPRAESHAVWMAGRKRRRRRAIEQRRIRQAMRHIDRRAARRKRRAASRAARGGAR